MYVLLILLVLSLVLSSFFQTLYMKNKTEVLISRSKKANKNTMLWLMVGRKLVLVHLVVVTIPSMEIHIVKRLI